MSLGITKKEVKLLKALQQEMLTQDHVGQAAPRFWVVRGTVKEYGIDSDFADGVAICVDFETTLESVQEVYEYLLEHHSETPYKLIENKLSYYSVLSQEWIELIDFEEMCEYLKNNGEEEACMMGYKEVKKIYPDTFFLTNKECKAHIQANYYHYSEDAHSYAMTAWRSPEVKLAFKALEHLNWDLLLDLASEDEQDENKEKQENK